MGDTYINSTGLGYYHNRLKTIFPSKTEFDALEGKVDEIIAEGGEPNVIETVKLNGTALVPDANKAVNVTAMQLTTNAQDGETFMLSQGTKSIAFFQASDSDVVGITADDGLSGGIDELLATTEYVQANGGKIDHITVNGTEQAITNKTVALTIPTKTSDITNDSDFQNETEVQALIDAALADITEIDFQVVTELPATGEKGVIYLVPKTGAVGDDIYTEYIWVTPQGGTAHFEPIGTTSVDLSNYWTSQSGQVNSLVAITTAQIDTLFA